MVISPDKSLGSSSPLRVFILVSVIEGVVGHPRTGISSLLVPRYYGVGEEPHFLACGLLLYFRISHSYALLCSMVKLPRGFLKRNCFISTLSRVFLLKVSTLAFEM